MDKHGFSADDWNDTRSRVAALPLGLSGMGLRKHSQMRFFAFWGAAARAVERFTMTSDVGLAHPVKISPEASYAKHIEDAWSVITSAYPETLKPKNNHPPLMPASGNINTFLDYYSCPSDRLYGDCVRVCTTYSVPPNKNTYYS